MIPGVDLIEFIKWGGVIAVCAVIFAESGLLIGFFLPGDSLLFTLGFLISTNVIDVNIHIVVLLLFIAAVAGDNVGYMFGHKVGRRLFRRPDSLLFRKENLERANKFYEKHGRKTIIYARFIPVVRTMAPILAGVGKMEYRTFIIFNAIGGLLWAVGITYFGYYLGGWLHSYGIEIDHFLLPIILLIISLSVAPPLIHILRDTEQMKSHARNVHTTLKKRRAAKRAGRAATHDTDSKTNES